MVENGWEWLMVCMSTSTLFYIHDSWLDFHMELFFYRRVIITFPLLKHPVDGIPCQTMGLRLSDRELRQFHSPGRSSGISLASDDIPWR